MNINKLIDGQREEIKTLEKFLGKMIKKQLE